MTMLPLRTAMRLTARRTLHRPAGRQTIRAFSVAWRDQAQGPLSAVPDNKAAEHVEEESEGLVFTDDPNMNGNYPDPSLTSSLPLKRQHRDPYGDWWDKIERRNYGEPIHEDNDILGVFSTEDYTHFTPAWGGVLWGCFAATVGALCFVVARTYPDLPATPVEFPDGLEKELGGPRAARAHRAGDEI